MNTANHPGVLVNNWLPHSFSEGSGMPSHSGDRGLHSEKVSQSTTSGLSSVTKTICPYSERDDWLLGGKQTFGVPLCSCHRDPRGMCPSLLWKFASGSCSEAGWQTSISPSTLTVAKRTTHKEATSVTTSYPFLLIMFHPIFHLLNDLSFKSVVLCQAWRRRGKSLSSACWKTASGQKGRNTTLMCQHLLVCSKSVTFPPATLSGQRTSRWNC